MAELDDWTCEYGGLVIGVPDSAVSLAQVDGLLSLPEIRTSDLTLIQQHGLRPGDDYLGGRSVTLTLEVYDSDRDAYAKALNQVFAAFRPARPESPLRFRFPGLTADRTAYVMARPRNRGGTLDLAFAYGVATFTVELVATDPHLYGDQLRTARVTSAEPSLVTQWGAVPARPVVAVTGARNPVLTNSSTGDHFGLTYTGAFTIDSAAERVTSDTGADLSGLITAGSVWPELSAGEHRLVLATADPAPATAVLTWRDAWV